MRKSNSSKVQQVDDSVQSHSHSTRNTSTAIWCVQRNGLQSSSGYSQCIRHSCCRYRGEVCVCGIAQTRRWGLLVKIIESKKKINHKIVSLYQDMVKLDVPLILNHWLIGTLSQDHMGHYLMIIQQCNLESSLLIRKWMSSKGCWWLKHDASKNDKIACKNTLRTSKSW